MKPIREDTRENQLLRALYAIELLAEHDESPEAIGTIYMIAHDVSGHCRACASGPGFDKVEQCEVDAKARNIYDVEKLLAKGSVTSGAIV